MRVSAVYLTYNPDVDLLNKSFISALENCDNIYVYDNNSTVSPRCSHESIMIVEGKDNIGVSGLNYVISLAFSEGSDFIIILDQDSVLPSGFVHDALKRYESNPGVYCPVVYDRVRSKRTYVEDPSSRYIKLSTTIGSGLIISKDIFIKVGIFDESFFLDCVDIDYCFRLNNHDINLYSDAKSIMIHSIGDSFICFFNLKISVHSPSRHYLYYRNSLRLVTRNYVPLGWKIKQIAKISCQWLLYSLLSKRKKEDFTAFILALMHFSGRRSKPVDFFNK
ncbi:glycosyltransferase family protein [Vibrio fluvialis]|uniref:hypothetical protein n=1 Tax=Vibrio fluvialis TaxID=676 RepID=UPI001C9C8943|nr:hypothetical protein [Vibrio fluvialis]MBY7818077.1 glycosyltransferase [Vibrio fluvialis]MBY7872901.1 glycosyltransferase [Vibrio fluvialis]